MDRLSAASRSTVLSTALHAAVIGALLLAARMQSPVLAPRHLAGTEHGTEVMLSYQKLGAPPGAPTAAAARRTKDPAAPRPHKSLADKATQLSEPNSAPVPGNASEGSIGDGDISIALVQFHPRPQPDLSTLPAGGSGDIVLNAVIDMQGHIAQLTVTKSLGTAVDQQVIATVQQWTFTPATRNGAPIPSEQEILFHYERARAG